MKRIETMKTLAAFAVILALTSVAAFPCRAQDNSQNTLKEGVTYQIWSSQLVSGQVRKRGLFGIRGKWRPYEWIEFHIDNEEAIRGFPREVKQVIAYYSQYTLMRDAENRNEVEKALADALGGFPSLAEAQTALLSDWEPLPSIAVLAPDYLDILRRGDTLHVGTAAPRFLGVPARSEKFVLDGIGGVRYVPPTPRVMDFDAEAIRERYGSCRVILNGERLESADGMSSRMEDVFLDPDNVASVAVYEDRRIIEIEQKNREPMWFSLAQVEPAKIGIRDTTVMDIRERDVSVTVDDGTRPYSSGPAWRSNYPLYVDGRTRIEHSMVASISPGKYGTDGWWIIIRLKNDNVHDND